MLKLNFIADEFEPRMSDRENDEDDRERNEGMKKREKRQELN